MSVSKTKIEILVEEERMRHMENVYENKMLHRWEKF